MVPGLASLGELGSKSGSGSGSGLERGFEGGRVFCGIRRSIALLRIANPVMWGSWELELMAMNGN